MVSWVLLGSSGGCYRVVRQLLRCSEWFVGRWSSNHFCLGSELFLGGC